MTTETKDEQVLESDLSCTFCGSGTCATWDVVTDDGVLFVCDKHHVDVSEAKIIRLERMMDDKTWTELIEGWEINRIEGF